MISSPTFRIAPPTGAAPIQCLCCGNARPNFGRKFQHFDFPFSWSNLLHEAAPLFRPAARRYELWPNSWTPSAISRS